MRKCEDPVIRSQMMQLYRLGHSHTEVAHAIDTDVRTIKKEFLLDPSFDDDVKRAMSTKFVPVLNKAVELAMSADVEGENEGAMKALDLVMKFYTKNLDREHATLQLDRKIEAEASAIEGRQRMPMLTNPEAVRTFMRELAAGPVIDVEFDPADEENP